jgi:hypothetical protein
VSGLTHTPPAHGERIAIGGYHPQYLLAASLALGALERGQLEEVRLADPDAGHLDDFRLVTPGVLDAYQVRWSRHAGTVTFKDLESASAGEDPLIRQLAESWERLCEMNPDRQVVAHLVTNKIASSRDRLPAVEGSGPVHFAAFVAEAWVPAQASGSVAKKWRPAWEVLQSASGLPDAKFMEFVRSCALEFGAALPDREARDRSEEISRKDLLRLVSYLYETVASSEQIVRVARDKLLQDLNWASRVDFRFRHEFPVDASLYEPIGPTVGEFKRVLDDVQTGYVAVLGPPGSGKSTLLTDTLRKRAERVVRYYAFVPDGGDPRALRGEAVSFLHDVVLALRHAGYWVKGSISSFDRQQLLEHLHEQLQLAHAEWQSSGRKTFVLVDGIDHIRREQNPEHSLVDVLPLPDQVPEGVVLILGSQHTRDLPAQVETQLRETGRTVQVQPLPRVAVERLVARVLPAYFGLSQQFYERSAGHPLALVYLLKQVAAAKSPDAARAAVEATPAYEGDIEMQYAAYWQVIRDDDELVRLLGLYCRLRGPIDFEVAGTWAAPEVVDRMRRETAQYFRRERGPRADRWYFFHNSFRLFLVSRTGESPPGVHSDERDRSFHRDLADRCAAAGEHRLRFDRLYHLAAARDDGAVLELATQDWFREQARALRPSDGISEDIRLAVRALVVERDPVAFSRLILAGTELQERDYHLDDQKLIPLLLALGDHEIAIEHVRDGVRLRIADGAALEVVPLLEAAGLSLEARKVFELAEPVELLHGGEPLTNDLHRERRQVLHRWAEVVTRYRKATEVFALIAEVSVIGDSTGGTDEPATRRLRNDLLYLVGGSLMKLGDDQGLEDAIERLEAGLPEAGAWWFALRTRAVTRAWRSGHRDVARSLTSDLRRRASELTLDDEQRVSLAELALRIEGDVEGAEALVRDVDQPPLRDDVGLGNRAWELVVPRMKLNRLLYAMGDRRAPAGIVRDGEARDEGFVALERALCRVGHIWGAAWAGEAWTPAQVEEAARPVIRTLYTSPQTQREAISWSTARRLRDRLFRELINAAAAHGSDAVEAVRARFDREFDTANKYWPPSLRREIVTAFFEVGAPAEWAELALNSVQAEMYDGEDVSGRAAHTLEQAEAWVVLGNEQRARDLIEHVVDAARGVGYDKDDQLECWIRWLREVNTVDPAGASARIRWFAGAVLAARDGEGGRPDDAAEELVCTTFGWSPSGAVRLFDWCAQERVMHFESFLASLLLEALALGADPAVAIGLASDVLMPLSRSSHSDLAEQLVLRSHEEGARRAVEVALRLARAVDVFALPSLRSSWRAALGSALRSVGIEPREHGIEEGLELSRPEDGGSTQDVVTLRSGETLRRDDLAGRLTTVSEACELAAEIESESYIDWRILLTPLLASADRGEVEDIIGAFSHMQRSASLLGQASQRLTELGDKAAAWRVGELALAASDAGGWVRHYDGGTRLDAFSALIAANPERGRDLLFTTLVSDLTGDRWYPGSLARDLEPILRLMCAQIPMEGIWAEIDNYVQALFRGTPIRTTELPELEAARGESASFALAELIVLLAHHPVREVAAGSRQVLAEALSAGSDHVLAVVKEKLRTDHAAREQMLMAVDCASRTDPRVGQLLKDDLEACLGDRSYAVRLLSAYALGRAGIHSSVTTASHLPATYRMALPPMAARERGSVELDADRDALDFYGEEIEAISAAAEVPTANVFRRAEQIIGELRRHREHWYYAEDNSLRRVLAASALQFPFWRSQVELGRGAILVAAMELADAGDLPVQDLFGLWLTRLNANDAALMLKRPQPRPASLAALDAPEYGFKEWVDGSSDAVPSLLEEIDEMRVIAEKTTLKTLAWGTPTELRHQVLLPADETPRPDSETGLFAAGFPFLTYDRYFGQFAKQYEGTEPVIVAQGWPFQTRGAGWIGVNPALALRLGWIPSGEGFLEWLDDTGQVVVKTVWWCDGLLEHQAPMHGDQVGQGWLVLAAPSAFTALIDTEPLRFTKFVSRQTFGEEALGPVSHLEIAEPISDG